MTLGGAPSLHLSLGTLGGGADDVVVGLVVVVGVELTQPTDRRLVEPVELHDVLDRELIREKLDRGRDLRIRDLLLGLRPPLPSDLYVDRGLVDAPLPGQLVGVQLQAALARGLQPGTPSPVPTCLCLCRLSIWNQTSSLDPERRGLLTAALNSNKQPRPTQIGHPRCPDLRHSTLLIEAPTTPHQVPRIPCTHGLSFGGRNLMRPRS
jgi:hypothetical protein